MSKTFKIVLSIASFLAFILLFVCIKELSTFTESIISAFILFLAELGALRIIWKKNNDIDNTLQ